MCDLSINRQRDMAFSVFRLGPQVGRHTLSAARGGGKEGLLFPRNAARSVLDTITNGKAILTTGNLQATVSSLTVPSRPTAGTVEGGRTNAILVNRTTDYHKLFPGVPQNLIPTKALPFLLKDRCKGLRPSVVRKRLETMRTYSGKQNNIRGSPWKLNLVCQLAAGLPVLEVGLTALK